MKTEKRTLGDRGENLVVEFLRQKNYEIVEQNAFERVGEIDIVAKKNQTFVFVEVKSRKSTHFGEGFSVISRAKIFKLQKAIFSYLLKNNKNPEETPFQLDFCTVDFSKNPPHIDHLENALAEMAFS